MNIYSEHGSRPIWHIFLVNPHINLYGPLDEKGPVVQRDGVICPPAHSEKEAGLEFEPRSGGQS